jgi:ubiquinol-cytochrome c reductase cytochrome b subunit
MIVRGAVRWIDDRLGASGFVRSALNKVFPDHWSFMIGELALYCFMILLGTGVFLTFFFKASSHEALYTGSYAALKGVRVSEAYKSVVDLSFDVRAGMVMRQMHHWAALVFIAAVMVHMLRVFFTGAFRRPREINWLIGLTLFLLAIFNGFTGYSLPDDLLSGTGLRIAYSVALSIPVVGTWLAFLVFGGEFPAGQILSRLFIIHVLLIPAAIAGLLGAHLAILWRQKHTQFPEAGRTETNVVGSKLWPTYAAKSMGLLFGVAAVVAALGGLAQINPVWLYGPFNPSAITSAAQPDWYLGWLEGALRMFPPWELTVAGFTLGNLFYPAVLMPGIIFTGLYMWPFLERMLTGDAAPHELLDRPRDRHFRTALGAAVLAFFAVMFFAAANDLFARLLRVPVSAITTAFRIALLVVPVIVFVAARRIALALQRVDSQRAARAGHLKSHVPAATSGD